MKINDYLLFRHKDDQPFVIYLTVSFIFLFITFYKFIKYDWLVIVSITGAYFMNNNVNDKYMAILLLAAFVFKKFFFSWE